MRSEPMLSSEVFLQRQSMIKARGIDCLMTNWNHGGQYDMDFGSGPPISLNGHFVLLRGRQIGIVELSKDAFGLRLQVESWEAWQRLKDSPVLPALAPSSAFLGSF